jgi:hypothetical protein
MCDIHQWGKRFIAVPAGFDLSMIQLHADCRARLIDTIADAISSLVVTNGRFISYSPTTLAKLVTADNVIPTSGKVRDQLTTYINETPISTFVEDQLRIELQLQRYSDSASMNLTEIGGYKDPKQVAGRLVDQISSLPWQYKLTIMLPQQLVPLLPPGENRIALNDQVVLVRADDNFQGSYPFKTEEKPPPSLGLLDVPLSWEPSAEYMQISANGFVGPYGGSTPAWHAERHFAHFLRSRHCA